MNDDSSAPPAAPGPAPFSTTNSATSAEFVSGGNSTAKTLPDEPVGNVKETIESILVAFILAFIFRAFVVEAFVIPTGSMAPTLMGAHMHFTCPDCGYQWDVGYDLGDNSEEEVAVPNFAVRPGTGKALSMTARCPNCGYSFNVGERSPIPLNYGDRILVLKYLYLLSPPRRWDVVVFKAPYIPSKSHMDANGTYDYSVNYIKRLTGKPGESLMILDGDIYISRGEDAKPYSQKTWVVQTKPRYAQEAMWRLVYNNDFHPTGALPRLVPWEQPWVQRNGSGWNTGGKNSDGRTFSFDNLAAGGRLEFDRNANPSKDALTNVSGYNEEREQEMASQTRNPVSDVKLDLWYQRVNGDGAARLELTKLYQTFIAELTPHHARLLHRLPDGREIELGSAPLDDGDGHRPMHIEFQNVDYQVSLRVDDKDLIVTTPAQYAPDVKRLVEMTRNHEDFPYPAIAIEADKQNCLLRHIALYRDTYYTFVPVNPNGPPMMWGGPYDLPPGAGGPVHLGPDEYFVCGDNSTESLDARYWPMPIQHELLHNEDVSANAGRVPGRFLLGKALFVYWPAGFRPFGDNSWAMIPNFGRMRFIH